MPLGSGAYVPSLRWRQAEYQALLRLDESIEDRIVPLITIPPIEFDFGREYLRKQCTSMYILSSWTQPKYAPPNWKRTPLRQSPKLPN